MLSMRCWRRSCTIWMSAQSEWLASVIPRFASALVWPY